jgi:glycosyltransferase involved in cell wall biosynthesis
MADVVSRSGTIRSRVHVIHNWADSNAIQPIAAERNPLRSAWDLGDAFVACYSGNMGRAHEFETILGAAEGLRSAARSGAAPGAAQRRGQDAHIEFLFIGGGPQRRTVEAAVATRSLANVSFRPYQPRAGLAESLCAGDVHLVSLRPALEGYIVPSKLYGILAAGRPAIFIGDRDGEIARIVTGEGIGYVIEEGDCVGLADALVSLASNRSLREAMGARARALLCKRYDIARALAAWRNLLEHLPAQS